MITDYRRGYCDAYAVNGFIVVDHNKVDSRKDIAIAARECNYKEGNWGRTKLVNLGTLPPIGARSVTVFEIVPNSAK